MLSNTAQYRLVKQLSGYENNLCVVGDDDQSIYGWRGANIKNILHFKKDFPAARIIKLEQNYRSTQTILNAANGVIARNRNRSPKSLWTENESGTKIKLFKASNEGEEGAFVAKTVKQQVAGGAKYGHFAVLYRNNAQSRAVEDQLVMAGIPYRLFGGVRFYERMEVKDILAYLKALENPADNLAIIRIINVPRRGIGETTIGRIQDYATEHSLSFSEAMREVVKIPGLNKKKAAIVLQVSVFLDECRAFAETNPVTAVLQRLLEDTEYIESLIDGTDEGIERADNAKELVSKAFEFEQKSENKTLSAFLEEVALVADIDNYDESTDAVAMMTLHSAKGLEFNRVFIVGCEENIFPTYRSAMSPDPNDLEEERRLCYVGFTRARQELYVSHAVMRMQYGQTVCNAPSRFLKEVPRELIESASVASRVGSKPRASAMPTGIGMPVSATQAGREASISTTQVGSETSISATQPGSETLVTATQAESGTRSTAVPVRGAVPRYTEPSRPSDTNSYTKTLPAPKDQPLDFGVGDQVRQFKYGVGRVTAINPAGADYEVTVNFERAGVKKLFAHLAQLTRVE